MSLKNNPTLKSLKIRVGLTIGDPAGIGPAITLKAVKALKDKVDFTIIGDRFVLDKAAQALNLKPLAAALIDLNNIQAKIFSFGRPSAQTGAASLGYLDAALELIKKNEIDCLVTCPVSKAAVNSAGHKFFGHTEYLAKKTDSQDLLMMLVNNQFKFSLATRHIALGDVPGMLTKRCLEKNILSTVQCLRLLFLKKKPKLIVCALNPHASDNGLIGNQEQRAIIPALRVLRKKLKGVTIEGPFSADIAISRAAKEGFDCVIAAYHDQALIPLKLTDFDSGVNLTFGLPFLRTSPLHGTAFDIASKPMLTNPGSLIAAIKLAVKCTSNLKKV